jgi:hypothetical protein
MHYLDILHPLLSSNNIHSCHFNGKIISAPNTLRFAILMYLLIFYCSHGGISFDVTINKNIALKQATVIGGFQSDIWKKKLWCLHILGVRANLTMIRFVSRMWTGSITPLSLVMVLVLVMHI